METDNSCYEMSDQILQVTGNGRIRVMIGERPVALAEKAMRLDPQSRKQLWCDQRSSAVAAVQHHLHVARNFSNSFGNVLDVAVDNLFAAQTSLPTR